jgi:hypothetical protein
VTGVYYVRVRDALERLTREIGHALYITTPQLDVTILLDEAIAEQNHFCS